MALDTLTFGFQGSGSGGGGGTNTNIANTDLTQDANRTLDGDGNSLVFTNQTSVELNSGLFIKNGTNAPNIRIFEASGSGSNYSVLTCGALASNRTLTIPDATGTIALVSDIAVLSAGDGLTITGTEIDLDAVLTTVTSITNTALKIGRDSQNLIDFATTDNKIIFRVNNVNEVELSANNFSPVTDNGCALGTSSLQWSDLFLNEAGVVDFANGGVQIVNNASNQLTIQTGDISRGTIIVSRNFPPSSSTDGNVSSGDVLNFGTGSVTAGVAYYLRSDGSWANTDQRAVVSSIGLIAVAMATGTASSVGMCIRGMVTMSTDVGNVGDVIFLQRNGNFDNAPSSSSGDTNRIMGYCLDDSDGQIFFNPSQDWVTVA